MSISYKFIFFRAAGRKVSNERKARVEEYELSRLGETLQRVFMRLFPNQFCNIYVMLPRKP